MPSIQGASQQACGQSHNSTINNSKCSCCTKRFSCSKYLCYLIENINDNINIDLSEIIENDNSNTEEIINKITECCNTLKQTILNQFLITNNKIDLINSKVDSLDEDLADCCEKLNTKLDYIISLNPINPDKLPKINGSMPICDGSDVTFTLNKNILTNSANAEFTLNLANADDCLQFYVILKDENGSYPLVLPNNDPIKLQEIDNETNLQCKLDGNKVILLSTLPVTPVVMTEDGGLVPYDNVARGNDMIYEVKKNIFGKETLKEIKSKK